MPDSDALYPCLELTSSNLYAWEQMPASGEGPRRTTSLEEVVISTSLTNEGVVEPDAQREALHSTEPLLTGSSPQQQGHWFKTKSRQSHTGSEYDPDDQPAPAVPQGTQQPPGMRVSLTKDLLTHAGKACIRCSMHAQEHYCQLSIFAHILQRRRVCLPVQLRSCQSSKCSSTCEKGTRVSSIRYSIHASGS